MKINLKNPWKEKKSQRYKMFVSLVDEFSTEYDVDTSTMVPYFTQSEEHLQVFIDYVRNKGYRVNTFILNGVKKDVISWGLDFDDDCELTIALKLKYLE